MARKKILVVEKDEEWKKKIREALLGADFGPIFLDHVEWAQGYANSGAGQDIVLFLVADTLDTPHDGLQYASQLHERGKRVVTLSGHEVPGVPTHSKDNFNIGGKFVEMIHAALAR
jgi:hypothetical protein